jgi:hypothetical protein
VVRAHHEFAYQFLDASDLWLFMTGASAWCCPGSRQRIATS